MPIQGHIGRRCEELESSGDESERKRRRLEEELTAAVLRRCHRCGLAFQKEEGCNKMTCSCGATSCYLCRQPDIVYAHFCGHPRDPGKVSRNQAGSGGFGAGRVTIASGHYDSEEDDSCAGLHGVLGVQLVGEAGETGRGGLASGGRASQSGHAGSRAHPHSLHTLPPHPGLRPNPACIPGSRRSGLTSPRPSRGSWTGVGLIMMSSCCMSYRRI